MGPAVRLGPLSGGVQYGAVTTLDGDPVIGVAGGFEGVVTELRGVVGEDRTTVGVIEDLRRDGEDVENPDADRWRTRTVLPHLVEHRGDEAGEVGGRHDEADLPVPGVHPGRPFPVLEGAQGVPEAVHDIDGGERVVGPGAQGTRAHLGE